MLEDPFSLMGRLVKKNKRRDARVYKVVQVAGMYVRIGPTSEHPMGSKRPDYSWKWHDFDKLIEVEL